MNLELLNRFYNNKCSPKEVQQVLKWFEEKNLKPDKLDELMEIWNNTPGEASQRLDTEPELNEILHKIIGEKSIQSTEKPKLKHINSNIKMVWLGRVAAILLFGALLSFLVVKHKPEQVVSERPVIELISFSTPKGAKKTFSLPDGTRVTLNSQTTITYPEIFAGNLREVTLIGEAFFEVRPNEQMPFIVKVGDLSVTALGTSFNIKSNFMDSEEIAVSLITGKVRVVAEKQKEIRDFILNPGEQATYSSQNKTIDKRVFPVVETLLWKDGILKFNNSSFNQVIHDLEMWYGVEISVNGTGCQAGNWQYTGEFNNQSLQMVLNGISYVKNIQFKIEDKKATIYCP